MQSRIRGGNDFRRLGFDVDPADIYGSGVGLLGNLLCAVASLQDQ